MREQLARTGRRWGQRLSDLRDLRASRSIDVSGVQAVSLTLGPYRNLTTLTASILFLHPNCQVLNHAGKRIFGRPEVDFLDDFTPEKLDRFVQFAIRISEGGRQGDSGGSIVHSHAFGREHRMAELFEASGGEVVKPEIRCLHWKESLRTAKLIRERGLDVGAMLEADPRLRFLQPIRHPIDCAVSNQKTGHARIFPGLEAEAPLPAIVEAILAEYRWFAELRARFPERFHRFFQHELSRATLVKLAAFLGLPAEAGWLERAEAALSIKGGYEHPADLVEHYRRCVEREFGSYPDLGVGLLAFIDGA